MTITNSVSGFYGEDDTTFTGSIPTKRGDVSLKIREGRVFCRLYFKYYGKAFAVWEMVPLPSGERWYARGLSVERWDGTRAAESASYVVHDHIVPIVSDWCMDHYATQAKAA